MPTPVSVTTRRHAVRPPVASRSSACRRSASRRGALTDRLSTTCSICERSASTAGSPGAASIAISMSSPISRRSIGSSAAATSPRSSGRGSSTCWRENASSWRVSWVARSAARSTSRSSLRARAGADPPPRDLAVAADHGQQVVEVVRDTARELADRLHLLRLPELVLEPAALGDVAQHEQVAAGEELRLRADLEHAPVAVLLAVPDVLEHALGDALGLQKARPSRPRRARCRSGRRAANAAAARACGRRTGRPHR